MRLRQKCKPGGADDETLRRDGPAGDNTRAGRRRRRAAAGRRGLRTERAARDRQAGVFLRRRHHRPEAGGIADRRAHVRRVPGAGAPRSSLPGDHDPWRQPDRDQFHRYAGRTRRLGAIFPAPGLCGLCRRPGGARPRRPVVAGERAGVGGEHFAPRTALRRAGALQSVAAGASAHPMAGHRQARRSGVRSVLCEPVPLARRFPAAAGAQPRCDRRAARPHRPGGGADPFAVRRLRLADRRQAAQPRQGDPRGRAQWAAGPRRRGQGRAGLVRGQPAHQGGRARGRAAHL